MLDTGISAKVFTVDVLEWESKSQDEKKPSYFGFEAIIVLHDPTIKAKKATTKKDAAVEEENKGE